MRRVLSLLLIGIVASLALVISAPQAAHADERDFTLVNNTGWSITEIYVSPTGLNDWQDDLLDIDEILLPNYVVDVHFPRYSGGSCLYDIRVRTEIGQDGFIYKVNLCVVDTVTFS